MDTKVGFSAVSNHVSPARAYQLLHSNHSIFVNTRAAALPDQFQRQQAKPPDNVRYIFPRQARFGALVKPPSLPYGPITQGKTVEFKVWAPDAQAVSVVKYRPLTDAEAQVLKRYREVKQARSVFDAKVAAARVKDAEVKRFFAENPTLPSDPIKKRQFEQIKARNEDAWRLILAGAAERQQLETEFMTLQQRCNEIEQARQVAEVPLVADTKRGIGNFRSKKPLSSFHAGTVQQSGTLYKYKLAKKDGSVVTVPDPWSKRQPEDVHGPSEIVDSAFDWDPAGEAFWNEPKDPREILPYRLHVGLFTQEGTLKALEKKIQYIKGLGYNAIELMPIMEFAGKRNWGYDKVGFFAVEEAYGHPDDLRRLVDLCHKNKIAVILDNVNNHIGLEGNYLGQYDPAFMGADTGWGAGFNFNNPAARQFFHESVKYWINEFHIDGYREDHLATLAGQSESAVRQAAKMVYQLRPSGEKEPDKVRFLWTAEDNRGQNYVTAPPHHDNDGWGGLGMKAQWIVGAYHALRSFLTGKSHEGGPTDIGGFVGFLGAGFLNGHEKVLNSLTNGQFFPESHDEMGNHGGDRIHELLANMPGKGRIASVFYHLLPGIPMTFMGTEYGERRPINFFVDHTDPILEGVFKDKWLSPQPGLPTDEQRFLDSKLTPESQRDSRLLALNQQVLKMRKLIPSLHQGDRKSPDGKILYFLPIHSDEPEGAQFTRDYGGDLANKVIAIKRRSYAEAPSQYNAFGWNRSPVAGDDEVLIFVNTSERDYLGNEKYWIKFPPGKWQQVLNTELDNYGGKIPAQSPLNNAYITSNGEKHAINLPAASILVFHKQ